MQHLFLAVIFSMLFPFSSYAVASSSNADVITDLVTDLVSEDPRTEETTDDPELSFDSFFQSLTDYLSSLALNGGVAVESDSNAQAEVLADSPEDPIPGEISPYLPALLLSDPDSENFVNVLRFDVDVNDSAYTLLFSPSYRDQLFIDSQDRLWNMGTSTVQGLVLDGDFNPYHTAGTLVYLAPCLGNNFSSNYNYGSPNYFRSYYWTTSAGSNRLSYNDTYVQITVTKSYFPFMVGDTLTYILLFLVGGGVFLCWLNRFKHY